jgi:N-acyl-D-amino-acid deacylase
MTITLSNATIIDGSGKQKYNGSILIKKEKIQEIGKETASGNEIIDCTGLYVAPGFIDVHTHIDFGFFASDYLSPLLTQGVTTSIAGNCGLGLYPYNNQIKRLYEKVSHFMGKLEIEKFDSSDEFFSWQRSINLKLNVANLIRHGNLHIFTMGESKAEPTEQQTKEICNHLGNCLDDGFYGLSTGLIYPPGSYLKKNSSSLYDICRVIAEKNGVFTAHIRDEMVHIKEAFQEILDLSKTTGCSAQISHIKVANQFFFGKSKEYIELIDDYNNNGSNVHFDGYPYEAAGNMLAPLILPPEFLMDQEEKIYEYLKKPEAKELAFSYLIEKMSELVTTLPGIVKYFLKILPKKFVAKIALKMMSKSLLILSAINEPEVNGKSVYEIAQQRKKSVIDTAFDLIIKNNCQISTAPKVMNWEDIDRFVVQKRYMVGSDLLILPGLKAHPRAYGSFTHYIDRYVKRLKLLSWEESIRKITSLPAEKFHIQDRGLLQEGKIADIVIFDPKSIQDTALLTDSEKYSKGIEYVLIGGKFAIEKGKITEESHGQLLLHSK